MTPLLLATATAAAAGSLTLLLSGHASHRSWNPTPVEILSITSATGILVALTVTGPRLAAVLFPLALLGPAAAVVDVREGRLPDILTGPLLGATLVIAAVTGGNGPQLVAAAVVAGLAAAVLAILARDLIGWGDVKLVPTLAVVLADRGALLDGLVWSAALIALTGVGVAVADRKALVPYGPALMVGVLAAAARA